MPQETVRIMCPNLTCRKVLGVPASARGRTVRCRSCGTNIRVPLPPPASDPAPVGQGGAAPASAGKAGKAGKGSA